MIRSLQTTTAFVYDSKIDLSEEGEVVYRDRSYFGAEPKGFDVTMQRGVRGHPIGIRDILRTKRISKKRSPGERPYAVIKNVFHYAHTYVTTVIRAYVKMMFAAFSFNLYQLVTLKKLGFI